MTRRDFITGGIASAGAACLSSPVRSNIGGSMTSLISSPPTPIDLPYVTDGLEAFWDGEWNIGAGMHNSSTATWVDLSGHKRHMYAPAPLWGENYAYCDGTTFNQIFRQTAQESEWFSDIVMSGRYTIEFVQSMDVARGDPMLLCDRIELNFSMRGAVINVNNSGFKIAINQTNYVGYYTVNGINYLSKRCHQFSADRTVGTCGVNGIYAVQEANFVAQNYTHGGLAIGGRGDLYGTPYYSNGLCIYRVSIYSRSLSQDELEFNLATDVARFGL